MRVDQLRQRIIAALDAAARNREAGAVALVADRTKALAVALAGMPDDGEVEVDELDVSTRDAASVLGFHPEHVRRLIRAGRLRATRRAGDYRIRLDELWPLIEARHREPGRRRIRRR